MRRAHPSYGEASWAATAEQPESPFCSAAGCPMPGAISESTKGTGPWFCRFHFGAEPNKWPAITSEVRELKRSGLLYAPPEQSPAVKAMLAKVIRRRGAT